MRIQLTPELFCKEIHINSDTFGNRQINIKAISSLFSVIPESITWHNPDREIDWKRLHFCDNTCVITNDLRAKNLLEKYNNSCVILTERPRDFFYTAVTFAIKNGILDSDYSTFQGSSLNEIDASAKVNADLRTLVNLKIASHVFISRFVTLGNNFSCGPGAVIGRDGFGFYIDSNLGERRFPHLSTVIIGENVEIGANTCIDRGVLTPTILGSNVKIDNLVHIAHNVEIMDNTKVVANVTLCGSCKIGQNSWIGPNSVIKQGIKVGNNVVVGMGSVVTKDVPDNEIWAGNPAKFIRLNT